MKFVPIVALMLMLSFSTQAQVYDLKRSVLLDEGTLFDTERNDLAVTGTMTINNGAVVRDVVLCIGGQCVPNFLEDTIVSVGANTSSVILRDETGGLEELTILSVDPLILMRADDDGAVVGITKWELRQ